jgi:hypothetical protein
MIYWGDIDGLGEASSVEEDEDWFANSRNLPCSVVVVVVDLVDAVVHIEALCEIHVSAFVEVVVDQVVREEDDRVVDWVRY